jgi:ketosteroid isomerase-like protein
MDQVMEGRATDLQRLYDELEIRRLLARYSRGIDRLDADLILSVYWPDAVDQHVTFEGLATAFVPWVVGNLTRERCTCHDLGQMLIEIDGDRAEGETYFTAHHVHDADGGGVEDVIYVGRYLDVFAKRNGVWKIARRDVAIDFRYTLPIDLKSPSGDLPTRRAPDDPSFRLKLLGRGG